MYATRALFLPRAIDLKTIYFRQDWAVVDSISGAEAIQWRIERLLPTNEGSLESLINIFSCSAVSALLSKVYSVVLTEIPDAG